MIVRPVESYLTKQCLLKSIVVFDLAAKLVIYDTLLPSWITHASGVHDFASHTRSRANDFVIVVFSQPLTPRGNAAQSSAQHVFPYAYADAYSHVPAHAGMHLLALLNAFHVIVWLGP